MKILITGATGIIGKKLLARLRQHNFQLKALVLATESGNLSQVEEVVGDLSDLPSLEQATTNVDIVIHLAGITHTNQQSLYYQINTQGTQNLIQACQKNQVKKFIFASSRTASDKGGAYAKSKLLAEKAVEQSKLNWVIFKIAEVYGAGQKEAIFRLIELIKKGRFIPIIGNGQYLLSPIFVDDLVAVIIKSVFQDNVIGKKYIIAGPEEFSYNELVNRIEKILKVKRVKVYLSIFLVRFLAFIFYIFNKDIFVRDQVPRLLCQKSADISLAKKDLAFKPINFEAGIKKLLGC